MITIGLTGSIAAGKTTVAEIFKTLNCAIFYADDEAKKLYYEKNVAKKVSELVGSNILNDDIVDFKTISEYAFKSQDNNKKLTDILYPILIQRFTEWRDIQTKNILVLEAALLFESTWDTIVDFTVNVSANEEIRIERIKKRNIENPEKFIERISFQWTDDKKNQLADYVINNDGKTALLPQINHLLKIINKNNTDRIIGDKIIKNNSVCKKSEYTPSNDFIYEVIRITDKKIIFAKEHYDRLVSSNYNQQLPIDYEGYIQNIFLLIQVNKIYNCNVKVIYDKKDVYFFFIKSFYPSEKELRDGTAVATTMLERSNPNLKKVNLHFRKKAELAIEKNKVFEVLLMNENGDITEGSRSNVFFIKDNQVFTAPDEMVLKGVTRSKIIEIIEKLGIKINFSPINYHELKLCTGAFLTGTSISVYNIRKVNNLTFNKADVMINEILSEYERSQLGKSTE